jgi:glutaredoxin
MGLTIYTKAKCPECLRVFDLLDEVDAEEFYYGHDCEDVATEKEKK